MVQLSVQGMDVPAIAKVAFASEDRGVIRNFSAGGFSRKEQASMIRRHIIWRNTHAYHERVRRLVTKASVA